MFKTLVRKHFDFLKTEYGFGDNPHTFGYKKGIIELEFYYGKGEIEICFFIRRADDIFKAYVSRTFDLLSIIRIERQSDIVFPENLRGYMISDEDMDNYLYFVAKLTRKYCVRQLDGDMSLFEALHLEWRGVKK